VVVNDPASCAQRAKNLCEDFPHLMPPTLISRDLDEINAFRDAHGRCHETAARPRRAAVFRVMAAG